MSSLIGTFHFFFSSPIQFHLPSLSSSPLEETIKHYFSECHWPKFARKSSRTFIETIITISSFQWNSLSRQFSSLFESIFYLSTFRRRWRSHIHCCYTIDDNNNNNNKPYFSTKTTVTIKSFCRSYSEEIQSSRITL